MNFFSNIQEKVQLHAASSTTTTKVSVPLVLLAAVGGLVVFNWALSILQLVLDLYVLPGVSLSKFGAAKKGQPGQGAWAVVTGATDGIGKEFALQLAKRGFNVFLASRTTAKLQAVQEEIGQAAPGAKVDWFPIDFAAATADDYAALAKAIGDRDVGVLVNNVGMSHNMPVPFHETEDKELENIVNINVFATLRVTKIVTPGMVKRKRGLVLQLGSFAGQFPSPLLSTYSGTKAFLIGFNAALGEELSRSGVTVQLLNTYFVVSAMSKIRKSSALIPMPKPYVANVLAKIGRQGGAQGRPFEGTVWPMQGLFDWIITNLVGTRYRLSFTYDQQASIRKRAIRKAERQAKAQ